MAIRPTTSQPGPARLPEQALRDGNERLLADLLVEADAVSFDLFDTLVCRPGLFSPKDLFFRVQEEGSRRLRVPLGDFAAVRVRAESAARVRAWGRGFEEVTLDEIYAEIARKLQLRPEMSEALKRIELEAEEAAVVVLESGKRLYDEVIRRGKPVVVVSDTYFDEEFVARLARRAGYDSHLKIYASSRYRKTKARGSLFDIVLEDLGCRPGRLLHVGDDHYCDVTPALGKGLKTLFVPTPAQRWRFRHGVADKATGGGAMAAMLTRLAEPRESVAPLRDREAVLADLGERHLAILFYGFAAWLVERIRADRHTRVFFAARDGLIIKRFFDVAAAAAGLEVDSRYLAVSRASLYPSLIFTAPSAAQQLFTKSWDRMPVEDALRRLSLTYEECGDELNRHRLAERDLTLTRSTASRLLALLENQWPLIEERNRERFDLIVEYLRQEQLLTEERAAFVDIGWHGTSQNSLLKMCSQLGLEKELDGYYLGTFERPSGAESGFTATGFLVNELEPASISSLVRASPSLLELLHSAHHGCTLGYRREGARVVPELEDSPWERTQFLNLIQPIQERAFEVAAEHLDAASGARVHAPDPELVARVGLRFMTAPTPAEAALLGRLRIVTDFGGSPKSITGATEWDLATTRGETLPDGTVPMWRPGFEVLRSVAVDLATRAKSRTEDAAARPARLEDPARRAAVTS